MKKQSWANVAPLPFTIETYRLDGLAYDVSSGFTRKTTIVELQGASHYGRGEDVTYEAEDHDIAQQTGANLDLAGSWTLETFSEHLAKLNLFPSAPQSEVSRNYRRWAYESAALDLALKQNKTALHTLLGREVHPVTFVVSLRLGDPATANPLLELRRSYPNIRFKLDPTSAWSQSLIDDLNAQHIVCEVADFKGHYHGTSVDQPPDLALYERVIHGLSTALIEDPLINEQTENIVVQNQDRVSWDAPIHSIDDIQALPFPPKNLNIKPSRFGSLRELLNTYDYCEEHTIHMYGGGQFELGIGRNQIQYLAAVFHPDSANDTSPTGFHNSKPPADLPQSPLKLSLQRYGFCS